MHKWLRGLVLVATEGHVDGFSRSRGFTRNDLQQVSPLLGNVSVETAASFPTGVLRLPRRE